MIDLEELTPEHIKNVADSGDALEVSLAVPIDELIECGGSYDNFNDYLDSRILGENSGYILEDISFTPTKVDGTDICFDVYAFPVEF